MFIPRDPILKEASLELPRRRKQSGYSLLMVVFMVATVLILAAAAVPNLLTQGRRERETETVWRGEQYERAIGMYYLKFGRYPTKIDDLTKQTNGIRFLRAAYTDPMNKEDGSWRFIYVGPNGQLIGSLSQTNLLQSVLSNAALPGAGLVGSGPQPPPPASPTPGGAATNVPGQAGAQTAGGLAPDSLQSQPQPLRRRRYRRKHHWSWKQDQGTIAASLSRRRHLREVGIHLESNATGCDPRASSPQPNCFANATDDAWANTTATATAGAAKPRPAEWPRKHAANAAVKFHSAASPHWRANKYSFKPARRVKINLLFGYCCSRTGMEAL